MAYTMFHLIIRYNNNELVLLPKNRNVFIITKNIHQ